MPDILSTDWMLVGRQEDTGYGGRIDLLALAPAGVLTAKLEPSERGRWMLAFWTEMLAGLQPDDAEQRLANSLTQSNITFPFAAGSESWLNCYFSQKDSAIGVHLGSTRTNPLAIAIGARLAAEQDAITAEIGLPVTWTREPDGKVSVGCTRRCAPLQDELKRQERLVWFRTTINATGYGRAS